MALFGARPVVASDLLSVLVSEGNRPRKLVYKAQEAIRAALQANESLLVIVVDSDESRIGVVTSQRIIFFRSGRLDRAVTPDRISRTRIGRLPYGFLACVDGPGLVLRTATSEEADKFVTAIDSRLLGASGPRDIPQLFPDFYRGVLQATGKPQSDVNIVEIIDRVSRMVAGGGAFAYFDQTGDSAARRRFIERFTGSEDDGEFQLHKPDLMIDFLWDWNSGSHNALRRLVPRIYELLTGPESFLWTCGDEIPPWSD